MTTLDTATLRIRPLAIGDGDLYRELYTDAEVMAWVGPPQSADTARRGFATALRLNGDVPAQRRFWVMQDRASSEGLGLIGLYLDEPGAAEVGVVLPRRHQGRGLATEAIAALADHAFGALGLRRLHTRHAAGHALAAGLMRSLGFEATAVEDGVHGWRWQLTAQAWAARAGDKQGPIR